MSTILKLALGIFLGGLLLFGGCTLGCGLLWSNAILESDRAQREFLEEHEAYSDLFQVELEEVRVGDSISRNRVSVRGKITNTSDTDARSAFITVNLIRGDGTRLGRTITEVYAIDAGQSVAFSDFTYIQGDTREVEAEIAEVSAYEK